MLMSLHKSMQASYNLYNKTRPSASKSSVARAKKLLEECGGAAQLQGMLHPSFSVETAKEHGYQPGGGRDVCLESFEYFLLLWRQARRCQIFRSCFEAISPNPKIPSLKQTNQKLKLPPHFLFSSSCIAPKNCSPVITQAGSAITSSGDMSYIQTLRGFRPKIEKLGNVISVNAMRTMEQAKLDAAAVAASVSWAPWEMGVSKK